MDAVEAKYLSVDEDLLVREALLARVEELNTVLSCLLLFELIHESEVSALRVEVHLQGLSVVEGLDRRLARRDLNEANSGVLVLSWKSSVGQNVAVRGPLDIDDALYSNGLLLAIRGRDELHRGKLVDTDSSLDLD